MSDRRLDTFRAVDMARSRLAENIASEFRTGRQELPICVARSSENAARSWRVTLSRLERKDSFALLADGVDSSALFPGQFFVYTSGTQGSPASPPRRSNPVLGGAGGDIEPLFVQIAWGLGSGRINRLLAHWPAQGASMVVQGSYVEVFAGQAVFDLGFSIAGEMPVFGANITPADGLSVEGSGDLSIQQNVGFSVPFSDGDPGNTSGVAYVPDFARRVRVVLIDSNTNRVADTGNWRCQGEWFDDRGNNIDNWIQGTTVGVEPDWQLVPARAVMLRLSSPGANVDCDEEEFDGAIARIHWRISP